jgi:hypothetical protein
MIPVAGVLTALQLLDGLLARAGQVSTLIKSAQQQGRDVTQEELDRLVAADDVARKRLTDAIAAARQQTPGS